LSDEALEKAKRVLPLPELLRRLGDYAPSPAETGKGAFLIKSPLREDRNPSFSVYRRDGEWKWSDKATGEGGDALDYLQAREGKEFKEARVRFLEMAGVHEAAPAPGKKAESPRVRITVKKKVFDWADCTRALTAEHVAEIAEWRGYPVDFVEWCRDQGWIGWYKGGPALPVHEGDTVIGIHHRQIDDPASWRNTAGKAAPLVFGDPLKAPMTILMESQWDAFAALAAMEAHRRPVIENMALIASRGADNTGSLSELVGKIASEGRRIGAVEQNDPPREDGKLTGNETWRKKIGKLAPGICFNGPPKDHKDLNDWLRAGMKGGDFLDLVMNAQPKRTTSLSLRSVSELRAMQFDDSDCYVGDRMLAAGQPTSFLGPGGIGKSRMVLQLAVCCILGRSFLDLETHAAGKKWLVLQTENSNRRIRSDIEKLIKGLEMNEADLKALNRCLTFHTIEREQDAFLDLGEAKIFEDVEAAIFDTAPDFVVLDPLNTFTSGDLNSDRDCRAVLMAISQAVKKGNPNRVPFVVHHSLTGKAGASKAVGWDRGSYGRNSKVLHAWVRSQWNLAPADPDDDTKLILACGKNNNGKPFGEIGVVYDEGAGIYRVDGDFDAETYREAIGADGKRKKAGLGRHYSVEDILECLDREWMRVSALQRRVYEETGMSKARFYVIWPEIKDSLRVDRNERGEYRRGV
jgi:hypothetical protein